MHLYNTEYFKQYDFVVKHSCKVGIVWALLGGNM